MRYGSNNSWLQRVGRGGVRAPQWDVRSGHMGRGRAEVDPRQGRDGNQVGVLPGRGRFGDIWLRDPAACKARQQDRDRSCRVEFVSTIPIYPLAAYCVRGRSETGARNVDGDLERNREGAQVVSVQADAIFADANRAGGTGGIDRALQGRPEEASDERCASRASAERRHGLGAAPGAHESLWRLVADVHSWIWE